MDFEKKNDAFWKDLLDRFYIKRPRVTIIGKPSSRLQKELDKEEKRRKAANKKDLGEEGLKEKKQILEDAIKANVDETPTSAEVLASLPSAECSEINFHPIEVFSNDPNSGKNMLTLRNGLTLDLKEFPMRFRLCNTSKPFVKLHAIMDTRDIPRQFRRYLPLFCEMLTESSFERNGQVISHKTVSDELQSDSIGAEASIGFNEQRLFVPGEFSQMAFLSLTAEQTKYEKAIDLLYDILYNVRFTEDRVKAVAKEKASDYLFGDGRDHGPWNLDSIETSIIYSPDSNLFVSPILKQVVLLKSIAKDQADAVRKAIDALEKLQEIVTNPSNVAFHMTCDLERLSKQFPDLSKRKWTSFLKEHVLNKSRVFIPSSLKSFVCIDRDVAALNVFFELIRVPMWMEIRELGLSDDCCRPTTLEVNQEAGLLELTITSSTNIPKAYQEVERILKNYMSGVKSFDQTRLEETKCDLIHEIIEEETENASILSYLRNVPISFNRDIVRNLSAVTLLDAIAAANKYVPELFNMEKSFCIICSHPSKLTNIAAEFKKMGREMTVYKSLKRFGLLSKFEKS